MKQKTQIPVEMRKGVKGRCHTRDAGGEPRPLLVYVIRRANMSNLDFTRLSFSPRIFLQDTSENIPRAQSFFSFPWLDFDVVCL